MLARKTCNRIVLLPSLVSSLSLPHPLTAVRCLRTQTPTTATTTNNNSRVRSRIAPMTTTSVAQYSSRVDESSYHSISSSSCGSSSISFVRHPQRVPSHQPPIYCIPTFSTNINRYPLSSSLSSSSACSYSSLSHTKRRNNATETSSTLAAATNAKKPIREDLLLKNITRRTVSSSTSTLTNIVPSPPNDNNNNNNIKTSNTNSINIDDIPGTSKGSSRKLAILYTCKICNTRSSKRFTERAYNHGVVLVRCPSCESLHLIADRLGYFGDKNDGGWDISKIGGEDGTVASVGEDGVLELTVEDVLGKGLMEETTTGGSGGDEDDDDDSDASRKE